MAKKKQPWQIDPQPSAEDTLAEITAVKNEADDARDAAKEAARAAKDLAAIGGEIVTNCRQQLDNQIATLKEQVDKLSNRVQALDNMGDNHRNQTLIGVFIIILVQSIAILSFLWRISH